MSRYEQRLYAIQARLDAAEGVPSIVTVELPYEASDALEDELIEAVILVNNAGAAWAAEFDAFPEHGWDKAMNLNAKSPFFLTQALHGRLRAAASDE